MEGSDNGFPGDPEAPEEPTPGRDGTGRSIAEESELEERGLPAPPPIPGDKQLSLAGLGNKKMPIEAEVSLMSAAVPASGLLDPDKEGRLIVSYVPVKYEYVPVRENGEVKRWKLRQHLRPTYVLTPDQEDEYRAAIEAEHREDALTS